MGMCFYRTTRVYILGRQDRYDNYLFARLSLGEGFAFLTRASDEKKNTGK